VSWFSSPPEGRLAVQLGRDIGQDVEIHYSSGRDSWWYHGPASVQEVEVPRGDGKHTTYVYTLKNAPKSQERVLVFLDQDPLAEAPHTPYTRTEKGQKWVQIVTFLGMGIADLVFLFGMLSFASAPVATAQAVSQAGTQLANQGLIFGLVVALVFAVMGTYLVMARRTKVSDWEIQPLAQGEHLPHGEAVYLVNSQKDPAAKYLERVLKLDASALRDFATAVEKFQSDTISTLQEQNASQRDQLDTAEIVSIEDQVSRIDLRALGRARVPSVRESGGGTIVLVAAIAAVVAGAVVWAILASGV
jgi:hypothetical protein